MEVNPRLFQWHGLAAACGVDLPRLAYCDLLGLPAPEAAMDCSGKRWAITFLAGERPALQRPPYVDAVFARDDLGPALAYAARMPRARSVIPESVERRARWVLDTLGAPELGLGGDVPYRGQAWAQVERGLRPEGDGLAEAFFHLARVEERGAPRDEHGRFPLPRRVSTRSTPRWSASAAASGSSHLAGAAPASPSP